MTSRGREFEIEEKELDPILIAGVRFKGKYSDCGKAFEKIARRMGMNICGKAFNLFYDFEYKEDDADIESCMPVKTDRNDKDVSVRELPGGRCVSLIHKGSYETLGQSYEKIMVYMKKKGYSPKLPFREVYLKGPGLFAKGKPNNYLTEIQVLIEG
jgi:effector-binding domain-containing protein